jgi:hypothetical protein
MKRPYYPTKAAWAAAKAHELRQKADAIPRVQSSNWRGVRRRMTGLDNLRREALRFEMIAERFAAQGK